MAKKYIDAELCKMIGGTCIAVRLTSTGELFPIVGLDEMPSADVRENVRGEWRSNVVDTGHENITCANCSACNEDYVIPDGVDIYDFREDYNFCPNCGADMRGGKDGE